MNESVTIKGVTFERGDIAMGFKNTDGLLTYGEVTQITNIEWQDVQIEGCWVNNDSVRKLEKLYNNQSLKDGDKVFIAGYYEQMGCNQTYIICHDEDGDLGVKLPNGTYIEYLADYEFSSYDIYKIIEPCENNRKMRINSILFHTVEQITLNGATIKIGDKVIGKDSVGTPYTLGTVTNITDPKHHMMNVRINNSVWLLDNTVHKVELMEKRSELPSKCKLFIDGKIDGYNVLDMGNILEYKDHYIKAKQPENELYLATYDFTDADIYLVHTEADKPTLEWQDAVVKVESPYEQLGKAIIEKERLSDLIDSKQDAIDKLMKERNAHIEEHNNILHKITEIKSELKGDVTND